MRVNTKQFLFLAIVNIFLIFIFSQNCFSQINIQKCADRPECKEVAQLVCSGGETLAPAIPLQDPSKKCCCCSESACDSFCHGSNGVDYSGHCDPLNTCVCYIDDENLTYKSGDTITSVATIKDPLEGLLEPDIDAPSDFYDPDKIAIDSCNSFDSKDKNCYWNYQNLANMCPNPATIQTVNSKIQCCCCAQSDCQAECKKSGYSGGACNPTADQGSCPSPSIGTAGNICCCGK